MVDEPHNLIIDILKQIQSDVSELKADVSELKVDVSELKTEQARQGETLDAILAEQVVHREALLSLSVNQQEMAKLITAIVVVQEEHGGMLNAYLTLLSALNNRLTRLEARGDKAAA